MNQIASIVVTVQTEAGPQVFPVDVDRQCVLVWSDAGWDVLAEYYEKVKGDPAKAKEVRERKCPKAKSGDEAQAASVDAVLALKDPDCNPTQWP